MFWLHGLSLFSFMVGVNVTVHVIVRNHHVCAYH